MAAIDQQSPDELRDNLQAAKQVIKLLMLRLAGEGKTIDYTRQDLAATEDYELHIWNPMIGGKKGLEVRKKK